MNVREEKTRTHLPISKNVHKFAIHMRSANNDAVSIFRTFFSQIT